MKYCTTCGKEWPDEFKLCPADGSSLRLGAGAADLVDAVIADRYHILKKLGEGGMGAVYLGEHVKMGQQAAIKVITKALASDPAAVARFTREARNAARIRHPNVCMIHDFGETPDGLIYMAMEYIEGESLADLLKREGRLPVARATAILRQCCEALQAAHDLEIVHRDIKPENIMITKSRDGTDVVKVVDFGIAKAVAAESGQTVTQTGFIVGTPDYMSPDQVSGEVLDGRSDIYSLAVVFFRIVTGSLPFRAETPQEALLQRIAAKPITLADAVPAAGFTDALQRVLDRALAPKRDDRFATAIEFGRALGEAARGEPEYLPQTVAAAAETRPLATPEPMGVPRTMTPETPRPSPSPSTARRGGRRLAAVAGLVIVAGTAAVVWQVTAGSPDVVPADSTAGDSAVVSAPTDPTPPKDEPTTGIIAVSGLPEGGSIIAGGQEVESPFELPEGRHEIEMRAPQWEPKSATIDVVAGERMTILFASRRIAERPRRPPAAEGSAFPTQGRSLAVGQTSAGALTAGDPVYGARHVQAWALRVPTSQRVSITMRSSEFDTYLYLRGPGLAQPLEDDDGAADGTNSRISTTLRAGTTYTVLASALTESLTGSYTLSVTVPVSLADLGTGNRRLAVGRRASGVFDGSERTYEGRPVQAWALQANAGTAVEITMRSDAFDSYLYLVGPGIEEPLSNDDGGGGRNARIRATLTAGGTYRVIASQYAGGSGAYTIEIATPPSLERLPTTGRVLTTGTSLSGTLTAGDPAYEGRHVQVFELRAAPGARVQISLRSDVFDTFLYLVGPGIAAPLTDDDGGEGTNSQLTVTLTQGGTYLVAAAGFAESAVGAFRLSAGSAR